MANSIHVKGSQVIAVHVLKHDASIGFSPFQVLPPYTATLMDVSTSTHETSMKLAQQFLDERVIMVIDQKEYSVSFDQEALQVLYHCTVTGMAESISTPPIAMRLA